MALVVIIDDDIDDVNLLKDALDESPYDVDCIYYQNPTAAMRALASMNTKPEYIFLDMNMPGLTGHECLIKLRSLREYDETVIALLSTGMNREIAAKLRRDGANFSCSKPPVYSTYKLILNAVFSPGKQYPFNKSGPPCYN